MTTTLASTGLPDWTITAAYMLVAAVSFRALVVARAGASIAKTPRAPGAERRGRDRSAAYRASMRMWAVLGIVFLLLGVNHEIDLPARLTEMVRGVAQDQGWYDGRRAFQLPIVIALAGGGLLGLAALLRMTRDLLPRHVLAFIGAAAIAGVLVLSTTSYHDVDTFLRQEVGGVAMRWVLELAAIACVGVCALVNTWWYGVVWKRAGALSAKL